LANRLGYVVAQQKKHGEREYAKQERRNNVGRSSIGRVSVAILATFSRL
jgi:hypothetical protein